MGVTTPQRSKQRDDYEGQSKDKYAKFKAEREIRQQLEILDQRNLHTAAALAEAIGEANAEAGRVIVAANRAIGEANAGAERAIVAANRARAESDRAVARERLLLRQQLEALNDQPYPVRTPKGESNLYEPGEIDVPPCRKGRPDRVATEEGAHMRGEQKLTNKKAGPIGGGLLLMIKTLERPSATGLTQDQFSDDEYLTSSLRQG